MPTFTPVYTTKSVHVPVSNSQNLAKALAIADPDACSRASRSSQQTAGDDADGGERGGLSPRKAESLTVPVLEKKWTAVYHDDRLQVVQGRCPHFIVMFTITIRRR